MSRRNLWDLTPREVVVIEALCDGLTVAEIAAREFVSVATVRTQVRMILLKFGVHSQVAAIAEWNRRREPIAVGHGRGRTFTRDGWY